MDKLKRVLNGQDWILNASLMSLVCIGLVSLFSTTSPELTNFYRQLIWLVVALGVFLFLSATDYRVFRVHFSPVLALYFLGVALLVVVSLSSAVVRGSSRWIALGPINIEPVELIKVILVLILAKYFSNRHVEMYRLRHVVISGLYVLIPSIFILLQPDLGSFIVLGLIWIGIIVLSGVKFKHFAALTAVALIVAILAWGFVLEPYQKSRVNAFLDPDADPFGASYNTRQSLTAIGSSGLLGKGINQGTQSQLGFLPEEHTDFIYAAIVEEMGILFGFIILVLWATIFWRLSKVISRAGDNFARFAVAGTAILLFIHVVFNISMTMGMLPVTGLTLPLVSYGGSSLVTVLAMFGIVQSINKNATESVLIGSKKGNTELYA